MKIMRALALIVYFLSVSPLFLLGWVAAFIWTPLAGGFWWGNRHLDSALDIHATVWRHDVTHPSAADKKAE